MLYFSTNKPSGLLLSSSATERDRCLYRWLLCLLVLMAAGGAAGLTAQPPVNPFEIKERLPDVEAAVVDTLAENEATTSSTNPFDLRQVPATRQQPTVEASDQRPLLVRRDNEPDVLDARGRTLGIHVLLLFITALLWIFFRPVLAKCYQALFNDGLLSQLYRQRENGQVGIFLFSYLLFFLSGGFFCYLLGQTFDLLPSDQPWQYWVYYSLVLAGLVTCKHLLLSFLAWLFPIERDLGTYNFAIMVFGIMIGMLLVPLNLLISYAPAEHTLSVAKLSLLVVGSIYLLRSFRGLLLANNYLTTSVLHFILYICTVEIAPLLVIYRYFGG